MNQSLVGARVHIVGVGGAGMSGLARLLVEMGVKVSWSDAVDSPTLGELRRAGVTVAVGHNVDNVEGAHYVTWSPSVDPNNVEITTARAFGARGMSRAQFLAQLGVTSRVIGLTGTHGKTTATSMMVHVMRAAGRDCSRLLGAEVIGVGANGHWGDGDLILEVDESYGTFALLEPYALGVLNVEADHLDHYATLEALEAAFGDLIQRSTGPVVAWTDDPGVARITSKIRRPMTRVGTGPDVDWRVSNVQLDRRGSAFELAGPSSNYELALNVIGAHNVANASVVACLAFELGVSQDALIQGLQAFSGAPRRFESRGTWKGVEVFEDYAHLPGEIAATIRASRAAGFQRIGVVFQPHRVSRTLNLVEDFATAFDGATLVVVTDIYTAGEANPTGVSGEIVERRIHERRPLLSTTYCELLDDVPKVLEAHRADLDLVLLLGAGDVANVALFLSAGSAT